MDTGNTIVPTTSSPNTEPTYVLVPEFTDKTQFFNFLVVLTGFLIMMVGYVYAANYNNEYTPNFSMLIDFLIDNNAVSHSRFKNYITDIVNDVKNEQFTTLQPENSNTNNSISFFDKIRFYINRFITNTFYVNKNTVHVKVNSTESNK
jgi:hypothetical protein